MLMLQTGGFGFQDLLIQLQNMGFFDYILPFLLIFALSYAILTKIKVLGESRGASLIIAIAIGLLSIQYVTVSTFFREIFSNFSIAVAVLLVAMILAGAFIEGESSYKWIFFGVGAFLFLIVVLTSLSDWKFVGSWWWSRYASTIIILIAVIGGVVAVVAKKGGGGEGGGGGGGGGRGGHS